MGMGLCAPTPELLAVGLMAVAILLEVLKPWPMIFLIDFVLGGRTMPHWVSSMVDWLPGSPGPASLVGWSIGVTVLLFLLGWGVELATRYSGGTLGQKVTYAVAADLFQRLQQLSLAFHGGRPVGDTVRRLTTDCASAATIVKDAMLPVASALTSLIVMFAIMWRLNPSLTLIALLVVPYMGLIFRLYARQCWS